ncbi:MAG: hypothetical protein ACYCW6_07650 [Candidatus Xenobia bacterium]
MQYHRATLMMSAFATLLLAMLSVLTHAWLMVALAIELALITIGLLLRKPVAADLMGCNIVALLVMIVLHGRVTGAALLLLFAWVCFQEAHDLRRRNA